MLLAEDSDKKNEDIADPEEGLISQEDIDKLLQGKDDNPEEVEDDTSSLISQQDIDTLLMGAEDNASEELDETGPVDKDDNVSGLVSQEDIDSLLRDATDQDDEQNHTEPQIELDRVVLEEADDSKIVPDEPPPPEVQKTEKKKWYRSRLVIACSAGAIVLLISSVSLYFFLSSDHAGTGKPEIASIESDSKKIDPTVKEAIPSGLSIDFNGFVVLDPRNRGDIAYLKADIQINCNSNATVNTIASRKPFFRFLIYDIFQKTLEKLELPEKEKNPPSETKKEDSSQSDNQDVPLIDRTKLQITIRQSLENALSEKGIKEIVLKNINLF
jgi:flagellar basal body-associated protein FliL